MTVNISCISDYFFVTLETKRGKRYYTTYMSKPTPEEVIEDFREDKSSFNHIN
ncbi:hypothetical protein PU629_07070 [Pullulanibacillus sp. KACC 23026]|uniref:hypothetical protein n=1 Tax=Pullulanibacillus sp. KACC 23026 TaxID=3028315 RepID=UPI0023B14A17|nr:hypothetical protein [Pullulanibacillus sp. KACC 23026]WEG14120.1 hypothetical protein PU629_07070 [Pullulanibacillus sp. KACC 23026]